MKDKISALMDDELELDGYEYLLTSVKADSQMHECWSTYHMIGDVIRGNSLMHKDFKQRLMQRIDEEPTVLAPSNKPVLKKPAFMSIAASVAAVMFVGWMVLQQQAHQSSDVTNVDVAQNIPSEYLLAHQSSAPSNTAYFIQPATYTEGPR